MVRPVKRAVIQDSAQLVDGVVTTAKLADGAVTLVKANQNLIDDYTGIALLFGKDSA